MHLPKRYAKLRSDQAINEVSYGGGGIKLFQLAELEQAQVGYSVAPDGTTLCDGDGAWQPAWLVIGYETGGGDPLFIDTADPALPVLTATHGEDVWEPRPVAVSFEAFIKCFEEFARLSAGRSNPGEKQAKSLPENRAQFLRYVAELNSGAAYAEFWEVLLEFCFFPVTWRVRKPETTMSS